MKGSKQTQNGRFLSSVNVAWKKLDFDWEEMGFWGKNM